MTWRCTRADQQDHHPGGPMWPGAAIGAHPGPWPRVPPPTSHLPSPTSHYSSPHWQISILLTRSRGREVARSWGRDVVTIQTSISNIVDIIRWQRGHQAAQLNVTDWTVGTGEVPSRAGSVVTRNGLLTNVRQIKVTPHCPHCLTFWRFEKILVYCLLHCNALH